MTDPGAAEARVARLLAELGIERRTSYRLGDVGRVLGLSRAGVYHRIRAFPPGHPLHLEARRPGPGLNWRVAHDELVRQVARHHRGP